MMRPALAFLVTVVVSAATVWHAPAARAERSRHVRCVGEAYTGAPIDLDVKDADLANALRLLAQAAKIDIVIPDDVKGTLTISLTHVPWDQALCTIAKLKQLSVYEKAGIWLIAPAK
jgi:type II secretory pathway component HofQ